MSEDGLVAGRECGSCAVCCIDLVIVDPGMRKLNGVTCRHCIAGGGCAIYETRYQTCRDYHCGWRRLADLDESWRPDRSGVLINFDASPGDPAGETAVTLVVVGGEAAARSDHFAGIAASFVEGGSTTYFALPAGPGFMGHKLALNAPLVAAVASRDLARVKSAIAQCHAVLKARAPVPIRPEQMRVEGAG